MKRLDIVFMGTPPFALPSLQKLKEGPHRLATIVTQPDRPGGRGYRFSPTAVKSWAVEQGLDVLQPGKLNDGTFLKQMSKLSPDLICTAAFGRILPGNILRLPAHGSINVHASMLPSYRGAAPIQRAVINGEKVTGVTIMYMDEELDAGDIILQEEEPIGIEDTAGELYRRLAEKGAYLLAKAVDLIAAGRCRSVPQDTSRVTHAPPLRSEEEIISWENPALSIHNQIRGMNPRPGAYTVFRGSRLKIIKTSIVEEGAPGKRAGEIVYSQGDSLRVKTGDGVLQILELQLQGKKRLPAGDFLRGYRLNEGELLGR